MQQKPLAGKLQLTGLPRGAQAPARSLPDARAWTREPCEDVDPMPDYENVLTD